MSKRSGLYPRPAVDAAGSQVVSQAGAVLLTEPSPRSGLDRALSAALRPWRPRWAVHDPAKVLLDLALSLAVGGDCLADIAVLRAEPGVFGPVASDPTVSRTIDRLADDADRVLAAIDAARAAARAAAWRLAGDRAPDHGTDAARRWSSTWTPPWSPPTRRKKARRRRSSAGSAITRCGRSSTTAPTGPASRSRCCCDPGTPAPTPPPTT